MPVRKGDGRAKASAPTIELSQEAGAAEIEKATAAVPEIVERAKALVVSTEAEAIAAGTFLTDIKRLQKDTEAARTALVKPLNDHVKFINATFREKTAPLAEADTIARGKVVDYERKQAQLRQAEQERVEREAREQREREEQTAREAREAAEAAAAAAAEAAQATSRAEQDDAGDLELEVRELSDEELSRTRDALGENGGLLAKLVTAEMERREDEAEAERARVELEAARAAEAEIAARPVEEVKAAKASPIRTDGGTVSTVRRKVYEVVDEGLIPRRFLTVDHTALNAAVQAGETEIAGVEISEDISVAVRAA